MINTNHRRIRCVSTMLPALAITVVLTACASSSAQVEPPAARRTTMYSGEGIPTVVADRPLMATRAIKKPAAAVFTVAKQVMADYGIPLTVDEAATKRLGNLDFYRTRQFAGQPMTTLFNCGTGMTGPNAASYRIYMSMLVSVADDGKEGSVVSVTLTASARDMSSGATADRVTCGSTGKLESLFMSRLATLIGE
jgi:hypothetical protein